MIQESHLSQLYRLANQDKTQDIKTSILALVIIACFAISSLLTMGLKTQWSISILIGALSCWFIGFSFLIIFSFISNNKGFYLWLIAITASGMIPLVIEYHYQKWVLLALIVIYILLSWARGQIRGEYNSTIHLNWGRLVRASNLFLTLVFLILLSFLLLFPFKSISPNKIISSSVSKMMTFNGISFNSKINDILKNYLKKQISSETNALPGKLSKLSSEVMANTVLKQTKENLSHSLHIPITGQETIFGLVVKWFKYHWANLSNYWKALIGIAILMTVWSIVVGTNSILYFILLLLSGILFWSLIKFKFITLGHKEIEKETFEL